MSRLFPSRSFGGRCFGPGAREGGGLRNRRWLPVSSPLLAKVTVLTHTVRRHRCTCGGWEEGACGEDVPTRSLRLPRGRRIRSVPAVVPTKAGLELFVPVMGLRERRRLIPPPR